MPLMLVSAILSAQVAPIDTTGLDTWNPFEGMTDENGVLSDGLLDEAPRFASAVGSALGVFEEE